MIKSADFYRCFEEGFGAFAAAASLRRSRGKIPKYTAEGAAGVITIWFKVNGKASAIPYQPGEFWPVIEAKTLHNRDGKPDDGLISWYQYTDLKMDTAIATQRQHAYDKVERQTEFDPEFWRQPRDLWLLVAGDSLTFKLGAGFPHTRLFYLDEADAAHWGVIFGLQIAPWLERFRQRPETLEMHMRRVHPK